MVGTILRWSARITGLLLVGMVLLFVIGEGGLPDALHEPVTTQVELLGMAFMLVGFLVGWRWEGVGGALAIAGFAAFLVAEMVANGRPPRGAIPLFAVPGILYLLSYGWRHFSPSKPTPAADP